MRLKERIPIVLDKLNIEEFLIHHNYNKSVIVSSIEKYNSKFNHIKNKWSDNPDFRFGQLLINEGIIPDGFAWYTEEIDWLIEFGKVSARELLFWGGEIR